MMVAAPITVVRDTLEPGAPANDCRKRTNDRKSKWAERFWASCRLDDESSRAKLENVREDSWY